MSWEDVYRQVIDSTVVFEIFRHLSVEDKLRLDGRMRRSLLWYARECVDDILFIKAYSQNDADIVRAYLSTKPQRALHIDRDFMIKLKEHHSSPFLHPDPVDGLMQSTNRRRMLITMQRAVNRLFDSVPIDIKNVFELDKLRTTRDKAIVIDHFKARIMEVIQLISLDRLDIAKLIIDQMEDKTSVVLSSRVVFLSVLLRQILKHETLYSYDFYSNLGALLDKTEHPELLFTSELLRDNVFYSLPVISLMHRIVKRITERNRTIFRSYIEQSPVSYLSHVMLAYYIVTTDDMNTLAANADSIQVAMSTRQWSDQLNFYTIIIRLARVRTMDLLISDWRSDDNSIYSLICHTDRTDLFRLLNVVAKKNVYRADRIRLRLSSLYHNQPICRTGESARFTKAFIDDIQLDGSIMNDIYSSFTPALEDLVVGMDAGNIVKSFIHNLPYRFDSTDTIIAAWKWIYNRLQHLPIDALYPDDHSQPMQRSRRDIAAIMYTIVHDLLTFDTKKADSEVVTRCEEADYTRIIRLIEGSYDKERPISELVPMHRKSSTAPAGDEVEHEYRMDMPYYIALTSYCFATKNANLAVSLLTYMHASFNIPLDITRQPIWEIILDGYVDHRIVREFLDNPITDKIWLDSGNTSKIIDRGYGPLMESFARHFV